MGLREATTATQTVDRSRGDESTFYLWCFLTFYSVLEWKFLHCEITDSEEDSEKNHMALCNRLSGVIRDNLITNLSHSVRSGTESPPSAVNQWMNDIRFPLCVVAAGFVYQTTYWHRQGCK